MPTIFTVAGTPGVNGTNSADNIPGTSAKLTGPSSVSYDASGNMYIMESAAPGRLYMLTPTGTLRSMGNFTNAGGAFVLRNGSVVAVRSGNHSACLVASASTCSPFAGAANATGGFAGDNGAAASARLNFPTAGVADPSNSSRFWIAGGFGGPEGSDQPWPGQLGQLAYSWGLPCGPATGTS